MGIFKKIKKKVKEVYKKVDVKLGGVLPGGYVKPKKEVKPKEKPEPVAPLKAEAKPKAVIPEAPEKRSVIEKVATVGLKPAQWIGNALGRLIEKTTGIKYTKQYASELAKTKFGKILGTATVGTAAALGGIAGAKVLGIGVAKAGAVGKTASLSAKFPALGIKFAENAKTFAATSSLLGKAGMAGAVAGGLATVIGSYPFAKFELAEASDKIGLAMFQAAKTENWDLVTELALYQKEMVNPDVWDKVIGLIPFANVLKAASTNVKAANRSAEIFAFLAEQERIKQENGESEIDKWGRIEKEKAEREEQKRIDDAAYYEQIKFNANLAKKQQRKEDEEYWNNIYNQRKTREAEDKEAVEKYWEDIKKANNRVYEETRPSNLSFGLL